MSTAAEYWAGQPGDAYRQRQPFDALVAAYEEMWRNILWPTGPCHAWIHPRHILEIGANEGANLAAFRKIVPGTNLTAIEPNRASAAKIVEHQLADQLYQCTIQDWEPVAGAPLFDIVFTRGVLIHIPPSDLPAIYDKMHAASSRYIVVAEYYAPKSEPILYRGEMGRLWRGDFAGDLLKRFKDLRLVDYRFIYDKDPVAPQDNITWFLLSKE